MAHRLLFLVSLLVTVVTEEGTADQHGYLREENGQVEHEKSNLGGGFERYASRDLQVEEDAIFRGSAWYDDDGNGMLDGDEKGVPGADVSLWLETSDDPPKYKFVKAVVTKEDGSFELRLHKVGDGKYYLKFRHSELEFERFSELVKGGDSHVNPKGRSTPSVVENGNTYEINAGFIPIEGDPAKKDPSTSAPLTPTSHPFSSRTSPPISSPTTSPIVSPIPLSSSPSASPSESFAPTEGTTSPTDEVASIKLILQPVREKQASDPEKGLEIATGATLYWSQYVTNTGNKNLRKIKVSQYTDKREPVTVKCPTDTLSPGRTMECHSEHAALEGPHTHFGDVVAKYKKGEYVSDHDTGKYYGGRARASVSVTFTSLEVSAGAAGSKRATLVNTGNVDLPNVKFLDNIDTRLKVTKVSADTGSRVEGSDPQNVEWTIPVLEAGERAVIIIDFAVSDSVPATQGIDNTCMISAVYIDDNGRRVTVEEEDSDSIDIVDKTPEPTPAPTTTDECCDCKFRYEPKHTPPEKKFKFSSNWDHQERIDALRKSYTDLPEKKPTIDKDTFVMQIVPATVSALYGGKRPFVGAFANVVGRRILIDNKDGSIKFLWATELLEEMAKGGNEYELKVVPPPEKKCQSVVGGVVGGVIEAYSTAIDPLAADRKYMKWIKWGLKLIFTAAAGKVVALKKFIVDPLALALAKYVEGLVASEVFDAVFNAKAQASVDVEAAMDMFVGRNNKSIRARSRSELIADDPDEPSVVSDGKKSVSRIISDLDPHSVKIRMAGYGAARGQSLKLGFAEGSVSSQFGQILLGYCVCEDEKVVVVKFDMGMVLHARQFEEQEGDSSVQMKAAVDAAANVLEKESSELAKKYNRTDYIDVLFNIQADLEKVLREWLLMSGKDKGKWGFFDLTKATAF